MATVAVLVLTPVTGASSQAERGSSEPATSLDDPHVQEVLERWDRANAARRRDHPPLAELPDVQRDLRAQRERRAEREARSRRPEQRASRKRSRRAFKRLGGAGAIDLARDRFSDLFSKRDRRLLPLEDGQRIVRYTGERTALVKGRDGAPSIVEATQPLRARDEDGDLAPVDLDLEPTAEGWEPANAPVPLELGDRAGRAFSFPGDFAVGIPGADATGTRTANEVFFEDVATDTDAWFGPSPTGVRFAFQLRSEDAPQELRLAIGDAPGVQLRVTPDAKGVAMFRAGERLGVMSAPLAFDADQEEIEVGVRVEGSEIVLEVAHRGADARYPIVVDPIYENQDSWRYGNANVAGWRYYQHPSYPFPTAYGDACCGVGFYIWRQPGQWLPYGRFSEWQYFSPTAFSYIHRADFMHSRHAAYATNTTQGMWSATQNRHQHQWTQGYSYDNANNAISVCADGGIAAWQCDEYVNFEHSRGNYVQSSLWAAATGAQPYWAWNYFGGARIWMSDPEPPTPLYVEGMPAGWVRDVPARGYSGANQAHVRWGDRGLGMWGLWMDVPGRSRQYSSDWGGCGGAQSSRCPESRAHTFSLAGISEGVQTVTTTGQDVLGRTASASKTVKVDRTGPTSLTLSGSLRATENKTIYDDATSSVRVISQDGSSAAPRSGVRTTELLVDGQVHDSVTEDCSNGQCPYNPPARDLTLRTDAVPDGQRTIQVRVKDLVGNATHSQSWQVGVDRRGDIYAAEERDADPAAQGERVASEWGQLTTHNGRRVDDEETATRGTVACSMDPAAQCGEVRSVTAAQEGGDEQGESFASYKGTSVNDARLEEVATILDPSHTNLGTPKETGPLANALQSGQSPPPAHGSTYELHEETEEVEIDDQPTQLVRRLWVEARSRLLLRETIIEGGEVTSDLYYDYRPQRLERSELPPDHFAVARPANPSSDTTVDYATAPPPGPPAEDPPPTIDEQVAEAQAFREDFGLRSDEPYVRETVEDPALERSIDSFGIPLTPAEESELRVRDDAEEKMDLIDDYGATNASNSYAGTYIDQDAGGLVYVGFTLNIDQHMAALRQIYPYPDRLRSFTALVTLPDLMALQRRVADDIDALVADGFNVVSVAANEETNSVVVTVPAPTLVQQLDLITRYGPQIRLEQEDGQQPENSRERIFWRVPPLFGGLHISSKNGGCSSGFSVRRGKYRRELTAGHCGGRGTAWRHFVRTTDNPVKIGRTVTRTYRDGGPGDVGAIGIKRRFATGLLLLNPGSSKRRYRRIRKAAPFEPGRVRSRRHKGTRVCRVGYRYERPKCGQLAANPADVRVCDRDTCRTFRNQQRANYRSKPGDSGSAVFRGSTAFGIHHTGPKRAGIPGSRYFTPIETVMKKFNYKLVGVR